MEQIAPQQLKIILKFLKTEHTVKYTIIIIVKQAQVLLFLLLLLRCIVIMNQALFMDLKRGGMLWLTEVLAAQHNIHLFFWAFWADFVTFPEEEVFFSTLLMTPTATV